MNVYVKQHLLGALAPDPIDRRARRCRSAVSKLWRIRDGDGLGTLDARPSRRSQLPERCERRELARRYHSRWLGVASAASNGRRSAGGHQKDCCPDGKAGAPSPAPVALSERRFELKPANTGLVLLTPARAHLVKAASRPSLENEGK
jgi:hypothetical protein